MDNNIAWSSASQLRVPSAASDRLVSRNSSVETRQSTDVRSESTKFFALQREMREFRKLGLEYRQKSL